MWRASGTPPECPPLVFTTPADIRRATSVLYPGQVRGIDYRPHGGLRFDAPGETGDVTMVAPMDGSVYSGARYLEGGELQHIFDFIQSPFLFPRWPSPGLYDFLSRNWCMPSPRASSASSTLRIDATEEWLRGEERAEAGPGHRPLG